MAAYLVDRHVREGRGSRPAIHYNNRTFTYDELLALVNRTGNAFRSLGLGLENRCLILLPDSPEFLASFLAAMKIGAVPVPVNTLASPHDYLYYLNDSRAPLAVLAPDVWPRIEPIRDQLRFLKHILVSGGKPPSGCESLDALVQAASDKLEPVETSRDDASYWLYTSGTTGQPKGVVHLHHDMLFCVGPYSEEILQASQDDVFFSASKLFFSYGLVNSLYLPLYTGGSVLLNPDRPAPTILFDLIEKGRPTIFFSVPTSYAAMLADDQPHDLSSVRVCISAGEPLPGSLYQRWRSRYGREILDGIGSSEFGYIYISNRAGEVRPGSAGKLIPPHEARILGDDDQPAGCDEVGELYVKSDSVAAGYWNKHERTKETFAGDWLRTHDNFSVSENGFYTYQGRADDLMKVGGIYVAPTEVEAVLLEHEATLECAVVAAPDADGLLKPKAYVVLRDGVTGSAQLAAELQDHVKQQLAHYKFPRWVEFVPELPKTVTGKIQRYKLRSIPSS